MFVFSATETRVARGWRFWRTASAVSLGLVVLFGLSLAPVSAEERKADKIPPAEDLELFTKDGVILKATFFPGTSGKDSVPILIVHDFEESRADYAALAKSLQKQGHAVIVPDLRGHGDSVFVKNSDRKLDAATLNNLHYGRMVADDLETVKRFLLQKNNSGELNIEKLCVVGVGMGAAVGMEWTVLDWSWPQLPTVKQGRDVKAVVLVAPEMSFRGLTISKASRHPQVRSQLSLLILVGDGKPKTFSQARRINNMFERFHPEPEKTADKDLFFVELKTSLSGAKLVNEPIFKIDKIIGQFVQVRLVNQSFPWTDRRSPLERAGD